MKSLVFDQASRICGVAFVEDSTDKFIFPGFPGRLLWHGRIQATQNSLIARLFTLEHDFNNLIRSLKPDELVYEQTMFIKQSTAETNHALASVIAILQRIAALNGLPLYYQYPNQIKQAITGKGDATKGEVIESVMYYYRLRRVDILDDNHADALAAAFVWLFRAAELRALQKC